MRVSEIFYSLSGEGIHTGIPTVFVRLQGCNLSCTYCDTKYSLNPKGGREMSITEIMHRVKELRRDSWVLITGGDPLCQERDTGKLVTALKDAEYLVEVEENGSLGPPPWFREVDSWSVDVKCPSSGAYGTFRTLWLKRLRKCDSLKFVVGTQEDLRFVRGFLNGTRFRTTVLLSPLSKVLANKDGEENVAYWSEPWLKEVAEFCKEHDVRFSLQIQKILYGNKRGV